VLLFFLQKKTKGKFMNIFTKISVGTFSIAITILLVTLFLVGCGSSRIMLNADIPESQQIDISISTQDNETATE
tara:strand:- start:664 stop:885 length:222 start_codon:yes stop_codon:yes gene_type:complete